MTATFSRTRPMLGTMVTVRMVDSLDRTALDALADQAFALMGHIGEVMSAHTSASDLGRMSRAKAHEVMELDLHTVTVLRAAQFWTRRSSGAFDPARAGRTLARRHARPGLKADNCAQASIANIDILSDRHVKMPSALSLDLGGIAKGYAVDQAALCLMREGVSAALINAGGDIRVVGCRPWPLEIRHAGQHLRDRVLAADGRMTEGALATSVSTHPDTEFVHTTVRGCRQWRSATVKARDCMTADALTKWALQSSALCPALKSALREHHACMWRS